MSPPGRLALRGRVVSRGLDLPDGVVALEAGRIAWVGSAASFDGSGWPAAQRVPVVVPGLVDVHCHGAAGHGFPEADAAGVRAAAGHHLAHGTTSLVGSLVSAPVDVLEQRVRVLADAVRAGDLVGVHLEGPFLSVTRCGAQDPDSLRPPDPAALDRWLAAGGGTVVSMTYAPELPGADDLVRRLRTAGVVPSVGHTDADAATTTAALRAAAASGPVGVTHLFNGMPALHHRAPGPVAAALAAAARGEAVVELIADGVHLAPETVSAVVDLVGPDQVALVTDAMAAAGMPDGVYPLGPQQVEVRDRVARLATAGPHGERSIAGGTARLVDVLRHAVQVAGLPLGDAVTAATATPARLLGLGDVGRLETGLRADVLGLDEALHPVTVVRAGVVVGPA